MRILARVTNVRGTHLATVSTDGREQSAATAAPASGPASAVNGGELLVLALATCYCNDLYREATLRAGCPVRFAGPLPGSRFVHVRRVAHQRPPLGPPPNAATRDATERVLR